ECRRCRREQRDEHAGVGRLQGARDPAGHAGSVARRHRDHARPGVRHTGEAGSDGDADRRPLHCRDDDHAAASVTRRIGVGVAASALCMDKDLFKKVMRDSDIPVARHVALRLGDEISNPFGYPVFVKPARLGSSIGITKVHDESELAPAVELARRHDEKVLVEELLTGMEVECGVLGNRVPPPIASLPGRIDTLEHEWYDYSSKYDKDGMELIVPPELPQETIERVQQLSVDAFVASECEGMARVDFFVRDDCEVIVNELK